MNAVLSFCSRCSERQNPYMGGKVWKSEVRKSLYWRWWVPGWWCLGCNMPVVLLRGLISAQKWTFILYFILSLFAGVPGRMAVTDSGLSWWRTAAGWLGASLGAVLLLVRHSKLGEVTTVDCAAANRDSLCEQRGQEPATVLLVLRVQTVRKLSILCLGWISLSVRWFHVCWTLLIVNGWLKFVCWLVALVVTVKHWVEFGWTEWNSNL